MIIIQSWYNQMISKDHWHTCLSGLQTHRLFHMKTTMMMVGNANVQLWKKSEEELGKKIKAAFSSSPLTETICFPPNSRCSFMELWCCSWLCRQVRTDFQSGLCSLTERWGLYVDMKQWGLKVKEIVQHLGNSVFFCWMSRLTPL